VTPALLMTDVAPEMGLHLGLRDLCSGEEVPGLLSISSISSIPLRTLPARLSHVPDLAVVSP
jgi:hypothetical protein